MAFSWKKAVKRSISEMKTREVLYKQSGENKKADDLKRRRVRLEDGQN